MSVCSLCENEFVLPQKKRDNYIFKIDEKGSNIYICEYCYEERAFSVDRYFDGELLCCKLGCARPSVNNSKYCNFCEGYD